MTQQQTDVPPAVHPTTQLRPIERFTGRTAVGLATIAVAATGFGILLVLVRLHWDPLERVDRGIATALNNLFADRPLAVDALNTITGLGGNAIMWWLVTVTAAAMLIRRQVRLAAFLVVSGLGALVLTGVVKALVGRLRPVVADPITTAPGLSFPSGHPLNATVFYGSLLLVFLPVVPRRFRGLAIGGTVTLIVAIGFTRAGLGVHYASDVIAGWLLGAAWLGVTSHAFRHLRAETGQSRRALSEGLEPEAAPALAPADILPVRHPWLAASWLLVGFVAILGLLYGLGTLVTRTAPAFDEAVPQWLAARRTPQLTAISEFWSTAGNTHWILAAGLIIAPLAIAYIRRWRPAVFLTVTMFGELGLFLTSAALVGRDRPYVTLLDGHLPTSSFPSGHVAATTCMYGALALLVVPRTRHWWRWLVIAVAVLMPALVALSRMYRGAHHPLDVIGGVLLALLWLTAVALVVRPNADLRERQLLRLPEQPPAGAPDIEPRAEDGPRVTYDEGPKRSAVVANPTKLMPTSAHRGEIEAAVARAGWPEPIWLDTTATDTGGGQTRQAMDAGVDVVFAAGGDGTVMACANAVAGTDTALAILPCGTGNLLARNLSLPIHTGDAVKVATANVRRRLDVGVVDDDRCFLVMAGMGFDAHMLHDAPAALKARIGWAAYGVAAARHLCEIPMRLQITFDHGVPISRQARTVLIANVGRLQGGVRLLPQAVPDDGLLDVAVLMPPRRRNWMALAWALLRQRPTPASIEVFRARHIHIVSDQAHPREVDGELIDPSNSLTVAVRPAALWLCVPPSTVDGDSAPASGKRTGASRRGAASEPERITTPVVREPDVAASTEA